MRYLLASIRPLLEDLAGTLVFYALYLIIGVAWIAAAIGLGVGLIQIALHLRRRERVPAILLTGVALTAILGLLSVVLRDPRFVLLKPSIVYLCVAATMLPRGWVTRYVPNIALDLLPARTFDRVGWAWAGLMFATAALNVALLAALPPREAVAWFVIVAATSKFALFGAQYATLRVRAGRAYRTRSA
ncbi:MAG: septation protein IspZ [Pseudomonadota bacterium]